MRSLQVRLAMQSIAKTPYIRTVDNIQYGGTCHSISRLLQEMPAQIVFDYIHTGVKVSVNKEPNAYRQRTGQYGWNGTDFRF